MGLFGSVFHAVTHPVSTIESGFHDVEHGFDAATSWVGDHWKSIATFAVGVAAFAGIAALCALCPFAIPALVTLAIAGVGSGVAAQLVSDLLDGRGPGKDLLVAGALSGALTVGTFGIAKVLSPVLAPVVTPVLQKLGVVAAEGPRPPGSRRSSTSPSPAWPPARWSPAPTSPPRAASSRRPTST
jgi:MFS family permease